MTIKGMATGQGWLVSVTAALLLVVSNAAAQAEVNIPTVTAGNPGNASDTHTYNGAVGPFGAVNYSFNIGQTEVTAGQYTAFLNAVAATSDTYGLYNSKMSSLSLGGCQIQQNGAAGSYTYSVASDWANRPVNYVSWADAARFANWLNNGQPTGAQGLATTENGAYFLNGKTSNADLLTVSRQTNWKWAIANQNEWYKAAFYDPTKPGGAGYWNYATRTDTIPNNTLNTPDPGNTATYFKNSTFTIGSPYYTTAAGAHTNSASAYGTYDQNGNVWEWTENVVYDFLRAMHGGSAFDSYGALDASNHNSMSGYPPATYEDYLLGFRVVKAIPAPTITLDYDWVYQNTPLATANRNKSVLTLQPGTPNSYTVSLVKLSGSGHVTIQSTGNPLVWNILGGPASDGPAGTGSCTLEATVTDTAIGQTATVDVTITVRLLGAINNSGLVTTADRDALETRLNGLPTPGLTERNFDLDGDGYVTCSDRVLLNMILNTLLVP